MGLLISRLSVLCLCLSMYSRTKVSLLAGLLILSLFALFPPSDMARHRECPARRPGRRPCSALPPPLPAQPHLGPVLRAQLLATGGIESSVAAPAHHREPGPARELEWQVVPLFGEHFRGHVHHEHHSQLLLPLGQLRMVLRAAALHLEHLFRPTMHLHASPSCW